MSTIIVTQFRATVRRTPPLRLSALLRHALKTAHPRPDGQPNLLPNSIPQSCCHDLWRCKEEIHWRVGDERNRVFFCDAHFDVFTEDHDIFDFTIDRWIP